ncbi:MAG: aldehyde ferredoxin oxidoreductase family protein [Dehalococcoidia bacterium]|nr:aldehyde ferredoxin oxidoreductase family protein [Dehalococcoidia bacterium]
MAHGYTGKILRVDLSSGNLTTEEPPDSLYRRYFGGEGFIGYYLLKELQPGVEPLGPDNKLIFAAGPLTGVPVGGCGRHSVGAKSPLTGAFGEAEAGGYWGAELKMAGFDAIIVEGKAEDPVYLFIHDGQAELRDARPLWGMKTLECQEAIRQELGDPGVKVAQIGPAGENLVRYACIVNDLDAFAGRTGLGAVMGSKNLKAVACRGRQRLSLADPQTVMAIGRWVRDNAPVTNKAMRDLGTASVVLGLNRQGGLPTHNFQMGTFDGADRISGEAMRDSILVGRRSCYACPVQCKREVKVDDPYPVDPRYGGPEYETIGSLGSNCGIDDLRIIARGNELVAAYGLDSISCGSAIAFAMECFERGLVNPADTGGLDLRFGNGDAMLEMVERIALRQGLGNLLAEGVARASKTIGPGAEEFALHVKGQELPMHEPRWKQGMGVGYAISPTGADHCHNIHDPNYSGMGILMEDLQSLGVLDPLPVDDLSTAKMRLLAYQSLWIHFMNCGVCCYFVMMYGGVGFQRTAELVSAVTGWNTSVFELMKVGERAATVARAFNVREGLSPLDDTLPRRFFIPQSSGPLEGVAPTEEAVRSATDSYYNIMGWPQGRPSPGKLAELSLDWVVPVLEGK